MVAGLLFTLYLKLNTRDSYPGYNHVIYGYAFREPPNGEAGKEDTS